MALSLERYARSSSNSRLSRLLRERSKDERERSALIAIDVEVSLPESLIIEILSWLPVKDLLQLKSVCKSWYAIISSRDFISRHLNNYYNNNNDTWRRCLFAQYQVTQGKINLCEWLLDETPRVLAYDELVLDSINVIVRNSNICGPCDGLYYLFKYNDISYNDNGRALWNPAINQSKLLPELIFKPDLPSDITYAPFDDFGFGIDPVTKDYKVVVIKHYWSKTCDETGSYGLDLPPSILAYSLRTDSWIYCGDLARAYFLRTNQCYMYMNGFCYWLGLYRNCGSSKGAIISFDMATNAFEEIDVPDYAKPSSRCLAVYDGSLSLLSLHFTDKVLDIWTFKEGSWTKQYTMGPLSNIRKPVGHLKDNWLVLQSGDGELVLIDPNSQELKNLVGSRYDSECCGVFAYMESLVSFED